MKHFKNLVLVTFIVFSFSSCTEHDCDNIEFGTKLADLLLSNFKSDLVETNSGDNFYRIAHTVLNIAEGFDCPNEVKESTEHQDDLNVVYSETEDFSNPITVANRTATITQNTAPNSTYSVVSEITFEADGYYQINNRIDNTNMVEERNEENNFDTNTANKNLYKPNNVIHIKNKGKLKFNKNNKPIYISKWTLKITE